MVPDLLERLTGAWSRDLASAGVELRPPLTALQVGGTRGRDRKVNILVFGSGDREPTVVLKVGRSPAYRDPLRREFAALSEVSRQPELSSSVPRPLGLFDVEEHLVAAEGVVTGTPLSVLLRRRQRCSVRQVRRDLAEAVRWIGRLQRSLATRSTTFAGEGAVTSHLQSLDGALPPEFVDQLLMAARRHQGMPVRLTAAHGDFWPANLVVRGDRVGVIDWEDFTHERWPFADFFSFLTLYALSYPWTGWGWPDKPTAFRRAFVGESWFSELAADAVRSFFRKQGLPLESTHLCYALFLMDRASPREDEGDRARHRMWRDLVTLYAAHASETVFQALQ